MPMVKQVLKPYLCLFGRWIVLKINNKSTIGTSPSLFLSNCTVNQGTKQNLALVEQGDG